jgi:hypothetical protein
MPRRPVARPPMELGRSGRCPLPVEPPPRVTPFPQNAAESGVACVRSC